MAGIPVVIAANGRGMPVRQVTSGAPEMKVATNGLGIPIVLSSRGQPFVVTGGTPTPTPAAVLSNPTGSSSAATTASGSVDTNQTGGTLYISVLPSASAAPSAPAFIAGTTGGAYTASTTSHTIGTNNFSPTGLTASTSYKNHYFQTNSNGNSNVSSSSAFSTTAAPSGPAVIGSFSTDAIYQVGYDAVLVASGGTPYSAATGTPPYRIAVTTGTLPTGLTPSVDMNGNIRVNGVPSGSSGTSTGTLTVTDAAAQTTVVNYSINVPAFPAALTITFGAKTRGRHGGHPLGNTGGALSITAGNTGTAWLIDAENKIVPNTTAGSAPPAFSFPYVLTVANATTGTNQTLTINSGGANTFSVTQASTDTASSFQLRTIMAGAILTRGDTIVMRNGYNNPTGLDSRVRPAVSYSGTGRITCQGEWADVSVDANGNKNRKHGTMWGLLKFDSAVSGDVEMPFAMRDFYYYNDQATAVGTLASYANLTGWGVDYQNCRIEAGPTVTTPVNVTGIDARGSTAGSGLYSTSNNTLVNVGRGIQVRQSTGGGINTGYTVSYNDFFNIREDAIDFSLNEVADVICNYNFATNFIYTANAHQDFIQSGGNTTGGAVSFGSLVGNIVYQPVFTSVPPFVVQALFMDDSTGASTYTNAVMRLNIAIVTAPNAIFLNRFVGPNIQSNTLLTSLVSGSIYSATMTTPTGKGGSGGSFDHNIANAFDFVAQSGSPTITPNATIPVTLTDYQNAFANWTEAGLVNRTAVLNAVAAKLNGTAKNAGDSTYNGAVLPNLAPNYPILPYP